MPDPAIPAATGFVITFPMVLSTIASLAVAGFWYWKQKDDARDAEIEAEKKRTQEAKDAEIHASFQRHEIEQKAQLEKIHQLELRQVEAVRRDELGDFYKRVDDMRLENKKDVQDLSTKVEDLKTALLTVFGGKQIGA